MLESRIFGPDEDSSRDSGKKNRTYAASLTVRARWGRIRFRDASQEAQYQRHVLDEDIRLSIRFLRIFFLVFAFGAVCFITMNGAFGRLGNDYLEVPHSAAAQCRLEWRVLVGRLFEECGEQRISRLLVHVLSVVQDVVHQVAEEVHQPLQICMLTRLDELRAERRPIE